MSALIGLGFTFFSGSLEAWVVDALTATGFTGELESVFGRGQAVTGAAMLTGSVAGGFIAQQTSLGVPFLLRGVVLAVMFVVAFKLMRDVGFTPARTGRPLAAMRQVASASIDHGWRVPAIKWLMVEALFTGGVAIYGFYALQPYLLELYGDPHAYLIAGLSAAIVAGAQMLGGMLATRIRGLFQHRVSALIAMAGVSVLAIGAIGIVDSFWAVIGLTVVWSLLFAATMPIRQAYINDMIPSQQRATILSFDSLMSSAGGAWAQPVLGRAADAWGYAPSYAISAGIAALGIPFLALSRRFHPTQRRHRTMQPIVSPQQWKAEREQLLVKEKELMRARDALAAERRRMPWMAVEKDYRFEGPDGPASLLDLFDGRRQLIVYRAWYEPEVTTYAEAGGAYPERACVGCSMVADQVAHPAHLNARDTSLAYASRAPQAEIRGLQERMGWEHIPWYTITDDFDKDFDVDEWHGHNAFIREGDQIFRTYFVDARGDEALGSTWSYLDITALGRQEAWEDSPEGTPQTPPYDVVELPRRLRQVTRAQGCGGVASRWLIENGG